MLDRGFITYSNQAKQDMLGVPAATLERHGAVSRETAEAMVKGALAHAPVDLAVSVTGIAGPDGGSAEKPVGLVHFGAASRSGQLVHVEKRFGNIGRAEVRKHSVLQAFVMLHDLAEKEPRPRAETSDAVCARRSHRRAARTRPQTGGRRRRTSRPSACRACGCGIRRR